MRTDTARLCKGGKYFFLRTNYDGTAVKIAVAYDCRCDEDNKRYDAGNYFKDEAAVSVAASELSKILQNHR